MVTEIRDYLRVHPGSIIACGFGVGLSWGTVYLNTENVIVPDLIEYGDHE
jgi:3-oxoacyl-[acyl-carrier-protein] synthase-3